MQSVNCWKCGWIRSTLTEHCQFCDAPLKNPDEEQQTDSEIIAAVSDVVKKYAAKILEEVDEMIPETSGGGGDSKPHRRKGGGMKWLNNDMLTREPQEAEILAVKYDEEGRFGPAVTLKLQLDRKVIFYSLRLKGNNPNLDILIQKWGRDESMWADKKITLSLQEDQFSEQLFPRIGFPKDSKHK